MRNEVQRVYQGLFKWACMCDIHTHTHTPAIRIGICTSQIAYLQQWTPAHMPHLTRTSCLLCENSTFLHLREQRRRSGIQWVQEVQKPQSCSAISQLILSRQWDRRQQYFFIVFKSQVTTGYFCEHPIKWSQTDSETNTIANTTLVHV